MLLAIPSNIHFQCAHICALSFLWYQRHFLFRIKLFFLAFSLALHSQHFSSIHTQLRNYYLCSFTLRHTQTAATSDRVLTYEFKYMSLSVDNISNLSWLTHIQHIRATTIDDEHELREKTISPELRVPNVSFSLKNNGAALHNLKSPCMRGNSSRRLWLITLRTLIII